MELPRYTLCPKIRYFYCHEENETRTNQTNAKKNVMKIIIFIAIEFIDFADCHTDNFWAVNLKLGVLFEQKLYGRQVCVWVCKNL